MTGESPFRRRRSDRDEPPSSPNEVKGWLVETITAWLHDFPSLRVEHDVLLKTPDGASERQIDVLLLPAGVYERNKYIVVECKNYGQPVDVELIDAFVGKLNHLGLSPSQGCYVQVREHINPNNPKATRSGFTEPAKERARAAGIKLLELTGIESVGRLKAEVYTALQSVIFLVADFASFTLLGGDPTPITDIRDAMQIFDPSGIPSAMPYYVWKAWLDGTIPAEIHTNQLELEFPGDWYFIIHGEKHFFEHVIAQVEVDGYVQTFEGHARRHELIEVEDSSLHRFGAQAEFDRPSGRYELRHFISEAQLAEYIASPGRMHIFRRVKAPRIRFWDMMYWPPSERVGKIIRDQMEAFSRREIPDPRPFDFAELEGTNINVAWEPMSSDYFPADEACPRDSR